MILSVENNLEKQSQYSFSSTNYATGIGTLPVKNINSFTASHAIQIGKAGEEQAEMMMLGTAAISGTALVSTGTTVTRFAHPIDTPIFDVNYDKIIFKRSTTGTAGTASALATVAITPDSLYTSYDDTSGSASYAYKTQYYNSVSGAQSVESAWFVPGGPSFYSLQKLRQRIKDALFAAGYLKDDRVVNDWINECLEDMNNAALKVNQDYALGTVSIAFGTAGLGTITASDFKMPRKVEISYDTVSYVQSKMIPINQFSESDVFTSVYPTHYWAGDQVFGVRPARNGGTARITYGEIYPKMTSDADELPLPLRPYTICFVEWGLWRAYGQDQKRDYANDHFGVYNGKKAEFINEITPRDQTGPKTIQFDDTLSGRADDFDLEYFTW